jgi:hypothetical protein
LAGSSQVDHGGLAAKLGTLATANHAGVTRRLAGGCGTGAGGEARADTFGNADGSDRYIASDIVGSNCCSLAHVCPRQAIVDGADLNGDGPVSVAAKHCDDAGGEVRRRQAIPARSYRVERRRFQRETDTRILGSGIESNWRIAGSVQFSAVDANSIARPAVTQRVAFDPSRSSDCGSTGSSIVAASAGIAEPVG